MSVFTKLGQAIFAGYDAMGLPRIIATSEAQTWATEVEAIIDAAVSAGNFYLYASKAEIDADLIPVANSAGVVLGDSAANDGYYQKIGATGAGSWTKLADPVGRYFLKATDDGGTANAIEVTTVTAANETQFIAIPINLTNTATPVTVSFNGGPVLTIKTMSGINPAIGGFVSGMVLGGFISGSEFRLLSDQASAAIQVAAEAAQTAAEAAQTAAEAAAASVDLPTIAPADEGKALIVSDLGEWEAESPADGKWTPGHTGAVEKNIHYILDRVLTPSLFKSTDPGVGDDVASIQAAINAAKDGGEPRKVFLDGTGYNISSSIQLETGVIIEGVGRQGSRLLATASMGEMFKFADQTGATNYYRAGLKNLWIDGAAQVTNGVELTAHRDGRFENVYISGTTGNGWSLDGPCYYNVFDQCTHDGAGRGWLLYNALALGSNENHWRDCRKNQGTDGWYIAATAANVNSNKLRDCMVEAHSGSAVYLDGNASFGVYNTQISGLRADSSVGGSKSITVNDQYVFNTIIDGVYTEAATTDPVNNGTGTVFRGPLYEKSFSVVHDFASVSANSQQYYDVTVSGISPGTWVAVAHSAAGGALSLGLILEARVQATDTVRLILHNKTGSAVNPANQTFYGGVRRVL